MSLIKSTGLVSILALSTACTSPGLSYTTKLMPENIEATTHREVAVERFSGPAGGWYATQFETLLLNTQLDNAPWFTVVTDLDPVAPIAPSGIYSGAIQIVDHDWGERHRTVSKCIEWDGLFDCETRVDVEEICYAESVQVQVEPQLMDAETGALIFSNAYYGDASEESCYETGVYDGAFNKRLKRKRREHGVGASGRGFGFVGFSAPSHLVRDALRDTLSPIRRDIAPRNAKVRATFLTEALDPVAKADVRFQQALDISREDPLTSCALWTSLAEAYPEAPAVLYNHGVCAEATHDFAAAQGLYAQASTLALNFGDRGSSAYQKTLNSLTKLSNQRYGLEVIKDLTGERLPVEAGS